MTTAIAYTEFGGPEVLHEIPVPEPVPAAGQLAIRVTAAGVNPIDGKLRSGRRPSGEITAPRRVGGDGAGVVTGVGEGVDGFRVGDPVVFAGASGAYATDVAVTAAHVFPRPPQVSAAEGAALGIPIGTAYQALRSLAVGSADTVLVHGGSRTRSARRSSSSPCCGERPSSPPRPKADSTASASSAPSRSHTARGSPTACVQALRRA